MEELLISTHNIKKPMSKKKTSEEHICALCMRTLYIHDIEIELNGKIIMEQV